MDDEEGAFADSDFGVFSGQFVADALCGTRFEDGILEGIEKPFC